MNRFSVLPDDHGFADAVDRALEQHGRWEQFIELRMGAGPTVVIERVGASGTLRTRVSWGSQQGEAEIGSTPGAIEAADRIAVTFYEMRKKQMIL